MRAGARRALPPVVGQGSSAQILWTKVCAMTRLTMQVLDLKELNFQAQKCCRFWLLCAAIFSKSCAYFCTYSVDKIVCKTVHAMRSDWFERTKFPCAKNKHPAGNGRLSVCAHGI
jgi:hypothetical protein